MAFACIHVQRRHRWLAFRSFSMKGDIHSLYHTHNMLKIRVIIKVFDKEFHSREYQDSDQQFRSCQFREQVHR